MKQIAIVLLTLFAFESLQALTLKGRVFEKGSRIPLKDITVYILPHKLKATTDDKGNFALENVPEGDFQFVINLADYQKLEINDSQLENEENEIRTLFVERDSYSNFETVIYTTKKKKDLSQKTLTQAEFLSLPGANGDPVKAVQNLPGVNRVNGFSSQVIIQGSAPKDTKYNIDGHEIPLVFHFGGFSSVAMPESLDSVEYLSAGYESQYSRALGGIISLQTKTPDPGERDSKGFFFVDTLKAGGLYEKRIDENSSYLISARHSYVGLILGKIAEKREDFNLTVVPEFSDFTGIYNRKVSAKENLKVVAIASRDSLGFLLKEPFKEDPAFRGNFRNETIFYRIIPEWEKDLGSDGKLNLSMGLGQDQILVDVGQDYFKLKSNVLTTRGSWEKRWYESEDLNLLSTFGFDNHYNQSRVSVKIPVTKDEGGVRDPFSSGVEKATEVTGKNKDLGLYVKNEFTSGRTSILPSLRLDSFSRTNEKLFSPRLGLKYKASDSLDLKMAGGVYYQQPEGVETDETFGNPDIKAPKAYHLTAGFEQDFRNGAKQGYQLSANYFERWFDKLVVASSNIVNRNGTLSSENYNNSGGGRAYGIEAQLKFNEVPFSLPLTGWISYTWSRSTRWTPAFQEFNAESDQTHNLNIIAAHDFANNWKLSGRYRYVTGNPNTPIVGGRFDADNDVYVPLRGSLYSERFRDFQQLDLRWDKKYILDTEIWTFYIDIQNILNQKNPERYQYSYDYNRREEVSGLPFLPAIGLKGEF